MGTNLRVGKKVSVKGSVSLVMSLSLATICASNAAFAGWTVDEAKKEMASTGFNSFVDSSEKMQKYAEYLFQDGKMDIVFLDMNSQGLNKFKRNDYYTGLLKAVLSAKAQHNEEYADKLAKRLKFYARMDKEGDVVNTFIKPALDQLSKDPSEGSQQVIAKVTAVTQELGIVIASDAQKEEAGRASVASQAVIKKAFEQQAEQEEKQAKMQAESDAAVEAARVATAAAMAERAQARCLEEAKPSLVGHAVRKLKGAVSNAVRAAKRLPTSALVRVFGDSDATDRNDYADSPHAEYFEGGDIYEEDIGHNPHAAYSATAAAGVSRFASASPAAYATAASSSSAASYRLPPPSLGVRGSYRLQMPPDVLGYDSDDSADHMAHLMAVPLSYHPSAFGLNSPSSASHRLVHGAHSRHQYNAARGFLDTQEYDTYGSDADDDFTASSGSDGEGYSTPKQQEE